MTMPKRGTFSGLPKTEWLISELGEDRDMRLLEDFWFADPGGRLWLAPAGSVINGASIPRALWSVVGSPYTDDYRRASIVHDVACDTPGVDRKEADVMFFHACRAGGCDPLQAKILYAGVRLGAWSAMNLPEDSISKSRVLFRKKMAMPDLEETFLQGKLSAIADSMRDLPDEASIEELDAAISTHIAFR